MVGENLGMGPFPERGLSGIVVGISFPSRPVRCTSFGGMVIFVGRGLRYL